MSNVSELTFGLVFEDSAVKYIAVTVGFLFTLVICCLCAGIIWYEQFGSDLKRILINQLVSSFCWMALLGCILVVFADLLMYFFRPFPIWFCYLNVLTRNAVIMNLFLLLDSIIIVRYAFIFWLKDPLSFVDTFWCFFINVCSFILR